MRALIQSKGFAGFQHADGDTHSALCLIRNALECRQ
jgi:hypothetical protein